MEYQIDVLRIVLIRYIKEKQFQEILSTHVAEILIYNDHKDIPIILIKHLVLTN